MNKGFTLIELLVVVLIIGILSAIALPQYETAVEKARATEGIVIAKAMVDAGQRFMQANPNDVPCLRSQISDVDLKGGTWIKSPSNYTKNGSTCDAYKTKTFIYELGLGSGSVDVWRTDNGTTGSFIYNFWYGPDNVGNKNCDGDGVDPELGELMCKFIQGL